MPFPRRQFCRKGHNKDITGRDSLGRCKLCENQRHRERYANNLEQARKYSRDRSRLDAITWKEALDKERLVLEQKYLYSMSLVLLYGRIRSSQNGLNKYLP